MKIMVISDIECKYLWDFYRPSATEGVDLIISCGDLNPKYLSFLTTVSRKDILYIHGNHDTRYERVPPEGCINIEDDIYTFQGIRILGLGGSYYYNGGPHQYSEREMKKRIRKLRYKLWKNKGFDLLVTHAAAGSWYPNADRVHRGFDCFDELIYKYSPAGCLHGHIHPNYHYPPCYRKYLQNTDTWVINGYDRQIISVEKINDRVVVNPCDLNGNPLDE